MRVEATRFVVALVVTTLGAAVCSGCRRQGPAPGTLQDEAMRAGLTAEHFMRKTDDYFRDMDDNMVAGKRPVFTADEIAGRNMWMVWTGGNDRLWDRLTIDSIGSFDLLKTISSHPKIGYGRQDRFRYLGLVNEPCYSGATGPDPNRFGLWLDVRDPKCPPDPFADAAVYPGAKVGARGTTVPIGSYYGEPTGVVGLRLFPNPDFDEKARQRWDSDRFYNDPNYYADRDLIRPYRVGMSCGFCHVGPNPIRPPDDPERPEWKHLSSNVGAQYFWWDRVFNWMGDKNAASIFYQALHVSRPGTLDTSLVSTDNINNPRTMNAVYYFGPRMGLARKWGKETIAGGGLRNRQFNDFVPPGDPLAQFFVPPSTTFTPRVLKDGSDSVGALGALNRVYINIGLFSEEWLLHFRPLIGGERISPIPLETAQKNSVYWRATEKQTPDMARFFLASTAPALSEGCAGFGEIPGGHAGHDRPRESRLRRTLCAVSLEQTARFAGRPRPGERQRPRLSQDLERLLGVDQDRRLQIGDAPTGDGERFSRGQLPVHRTARADHRAGHQRVQPARHQRDSRQHLGQLLVRVLQDAAVGGLDQDSPSRERPRARLSAAGGRSRLHQAGIARQPVVHGAISPEQYRRPVRVEPVGRGAHALVRAVDRADVVAGAPAQGSVVRQPDRTGCRFDRSHHG